MSALYTFLTARLAEDEAVAVAAVASSWQAPTWTAKDDGAGDGQFGYVMADRKPVCGHESGDVAMPNADHIARHDPARVLREVAAKRQILADCQDTEDYGDMSPDAGQLVDAVLASLAAAYSDHPDFDPAWG